MKRSTPMMWIAAIIAALAFAGNAEATSAEEGVKGSITAISPHASKALATPHELRNALRTGSVELDLDALRALATSDAGSRDNVLLQPFEGVSVEIDGESLALSNSATVVGRLTNGESGIFILSWAGSNRYGMLEAGLSRYIFQSNPEDAANVLRVKEVDQGSFAGCGTAPSEGKSRWLESAAKGAKDSKEAKSQPANHKVLEVMVLYSTAVANNYSGDPAAMINVLEASLTGALSASSVTGSARVVRYLEVAYTEPNPMGYNEYLALRDALRAGTSPWSAIPGSRANYRADLVVMLVDGSVAGGSGGNFPICGIAYVVDDSTDSTLAYSVMQDGCAAGDLTFAHEVTHLAGGRHDWTSDPAVGYGGTSEAHGYTNTTIDFRTVMGSRSSCTYAGGCARLNRFSSPSQTAIVGGTSYAVGVTDELPGTPGNQETDMVTVLGTSVEATAAYKTSGDAAPGQPASMTVDRLCSGVNELSWPAPSGTTGWYEAESSTTSGYSSPITEYRGGQNSFFLTVSGTRWVRVRACNAEGCGSYRNGSQTATVGCP